MNMQEISAESSVSNLPEIRRVASRIADFILRTPTVRWPIPPIGGGPVSELYVKLELLQIAGSFKARAAVNTILEQMTDNRMPSDFPGVTAFSAGNHAIAVAFAARRLGVSAKVVMPRTANPFRVERCEAYGAEIVFGDTIKDLLELTKGVAEQEGRLLIHPFEGRATALATATVGLELCEDVPELDAVIVPVGGGGLIAGIAMAVKQIQPSCMVIGVEPAGACGMRQSLLERSPRSSVHVDTIADSLGAPMHEPLSFGLVRRHVDQIVTVSDDELRVAMRQMFHDLKLAVEPACAAALAAYNGPLTEVLQGKRTALIACGSNIDLASYQSLVGS
ncbi:MAG: threonine/serine dehydratase [Granulosicoccus sp.]